MNLKLVQKEIKQALDNLENIDISNTLKAEAILLAIQPLLESPIPTVKLFSSAKAKLH